MRENIFIINLITLNNTFVQDKWNRNQDNCLNVNVCNRLICGGEEKSKIALGLNAKNL